MRILWFTNTSSCYECNKSNRYNGGGWISSLQKIIEKDPNIQLAVSFHMNDEPFKVVIKGTTYYPIPAVPYTTINKIIRFVFKGKNSIYKAQENYCLNSYLKVIEDYKPDIIHIFGSEQNFSLLAENTNIPIILHIQGFVTPILNAFFPPAISEYKYIWSDFIPQNVIKRKRTISLFKKGAERETRTLKKINYYLGRTNWDYNCSKIYSPNSIYYHCDEILRDSFYEQLPTVNRVKGRIVTTISSPLYKGEDLILKTAKLLKELDIEFEWRIFGIQSSSNINNLLKISPNNVGIKYCGIIDEKELKKELLECSIYFHPTYIDNSPNSLCEAQILGCPIITTNVGGTSTLVEHGKTGYLIPANDPFQAAYYIKSILYNTEKAKQMGIEGRNIAIKRHNPITIKQQLLLAYEQINCNK